MLSLLRPPAVPLVRRVACSLVWCCCVAREEEEMYRSCRRSVLVKLGRRGSDVLYGAFLDSLFLTLFLPPIYKKYYRSLRMACVSKVG